MFLFFVFFFCFLYFPNVCRYVFFRASNVPLVFLLLLLFFLLFPKFFSLFRNVILIMLAMLVILRWPRMQNRIGHLKVVTQAYAAALVLRKGDVGIGRPGVSSVQSFSSNNKKGTPALARPRKIANKPGIFGGPGRPSGNILRVCNFVKVQQLRSSGSLSYSNLQLRTECVNEIDHTDV